MRKNISRISKHIIDVLRKFWKEKVSIILKKCASFCLKGMKILLRLLYKIIRMISLLAVVILPFCHNGVNHTIAQWVWYPSIVLSVVCTVFDYARRKEPIFQEPELQYLSNIGEIIFWPFIASIFVINFYDIDRLCLYIIFAVLLIAIPCFFYSFWRFALMHNNLSEKEKENGKKNIAKQICLYWLFDFLFLCIVNGWVIYIYVFGTIAIVAIFLNLIEVFFSDAKSIKVFLPFELLLGIGLSIYLIYIVPDVALREIILTIVASVYGGLLALTGVAWTIRNENSVRQAELLRVEDERKEEERIKHIPYIRVSLEHVNPLLYVDARITSILDLEKHKELLEGNTFYSINIKNFTIKNISNANIILQGVIVSGKYYKFKKKEIVEPGTYCQISTTNNWSVSVAFPEEYISLIVRDVLGYRYEIQCVVSYEFKDNYSMIKVNIDEEELTGFCYIYSITSVELPILIDRKEK